jgi:hypothetical protein
MRAAGRDPAASNWTASPTNAMRSSPALATSGSGNTTLIRSDAVRLSRRSVTWTVSR